MRTALRYCGGNLAYDLFPPATADTEAGIRRLLDEYHLKSEIDLGGDASDTDLFCMMSVLRADSPTRLTKSADECCQRHSMRASLRISNLAMPLVICGLSLESRSINRSLRTDITSGPRP
jgi:hypothetical protein